MKIRKDPASPYGIRIYMEKDEMDDICLNELHKSKRYLPKEPGPINIERFLEGYLEVKIEYQDLEEGYLGCTRFTRLGKPDKVIVSNRLLENYKSTERRLRSTLAHEAGHCLFHPPLFIRDDTQTSLFPEEQSKDPLRILCRDTDIEAGERGYNGRWWEFQANRAIGGLLLPIPLLEKALGNALAVSPVSGAKSLPGADFDRAVKAISEKFDVNPIVAKYRLSELYKTETGQVAF